MLIHEIFSKVTLLGSTLSTSLTASSTCSLILEKARSMGGARANFERPMSPRNLSAVRISALTRRLPLTMLDRRLPMRNLTRVEVGRVRKAGPW